MADDQDERPSDGDVKGLRKLIDEANARAEAAEKKAAEIEAKTARDAAFATAGIPTGGMGEMFRDSYKGELTPDAIKAKALEVGLIQQERATPSDERDQLLSLQSDQAPSTSRVPDKSVLQDAMTKINSMTDNEEIFDLVRSLGMYAG